MSSEQDKALEDLIQVISDNIGLEWKFLARILEFTDTDIDAIEYANQRDLKEQIYQFFREWKRRSGDEATRDLLLAAVVGADLTELVKTLEKKGFCDNGPPSEASTPLSPSGSSHLPPDTSTPPRPPNLVNRLDEDVVQDSTASTEQHESLPTEQPQGPLAQQNSPVANNLHTISPQNSPTAVKHSPNLASSRPPVSNKLSRSDDSQADQEFLRQKRLKRFASNASNNSTASDASNQDTQRQSSCSSVPESPGVTDLDTQEHNNLSVSSPVRRPQPAVCPFELGDMVMVERADAAPWYGVVRWIGDLPGKPGKPVIGMEMESEVLGGGDGMIDGQRFFFCEDKHGLFLPADKVKKDNRFDAPDDSTASELPANRSNSGVGLESNVTSNTSSNEPASFPGMRSVEDLLRGLNHSSDSSPTADGGASNSESNDSRERVLMFTIPADHAGLVIGREGRNIQEVERLTNTNIQMGRDYGGLGGNKRGVIRGSEENQKKALQMILNRLKRRVDLHTAKAETIQIPESKVGSVIGKGGETINAIKRLSGVVDIKVDEGPTGLQSFSLFGGPQTRNCVITGSEKDIEKAKRFINMAVMGGNIPMAATLAALIADLANLGVDVEESS